jgi:hypothetical protein
VSVNSNPGDPKNTKEAVSGGEWRKWKGGLFKEYDNFIQREAWKTVPRPPGRKVMRTKNVYKKKPHAITKETRYKVRNVVLGYEQIPGIDYTESYAAVVADQTVRTMLAVSLYMSELVTNWEIAKSLDVEAAFLNAELEELVYIEIPEYYTEYCESRGHEVPPDGSVFLLAMGQYGLVQVARAWVKRFTKILVAPGLGMKQCKTDPCLFVKHDEKGKLVLMAIIYIDDCIYCGTKEEILKLKK